jgi:predicted branched-subunit amino acid permease
MEQHTPTPAKASPQRIVRAPQKGMRRWMGWRELPLLAILVWVFLVLPTQGSALQRARLGYFFLALAALFLTMNLTMVAKRRSVVPVLLSLSGTATVLGLADDWFVRAALILCVVALDAGVLLWARSRHP